MPKAGNDTSPSSYRVLDRWIRMAALHYRTGQIHDYGCIGDAYTRPPQSSGDFAGQLHGEQHVSLRTDWCKHAFWRLQPTTRYIPART